MQTGALVVLSSCSCTFLTRHLSYTRIYRCLYRLIRCFHRVDLFASDLSLLPLWLSQPASYRTARGLKVKTHAGRPYLASLFSSLMCALSWMHAPLGYNQVVPFSRVSQRQCFRLFCFCIYSWRYESRWLSEQAKTEAFSSRFRDCGRAYYLAGWLSCFHPLFGPFWAQAPWVSLLLEYGTILFDEVSFAAQEFGFP